MSIKLRDYQIDLKNDLYSSWSQGNDNVILVSPTGSGKTVVMASIADDQPGPGVAIAHRVELVGQISLAMAQMGIEHNVIGPTNTVTFCIRQQINQFGRKYYNPNARVTVAAVDTLKARSGKLQQWCAQQTWWMVDECFVAGTNIQMADGSLRHIEHMKVGDIVTAFDENTGDFVSRRVTQLFKNPAPEKMIRVAGSHHVLYATSGHPFWTRRGWVNAGDLRNDDEIYTTTMHTVRYYGERDERGSEVSVASNRSDLLHPDVRLRSQRRKTTSGFSKTDADEMLHLRWRCDAVERTDGNVSQNWSSILQQAMLGQVSLGTIIKGHGEHEPQVCFETDDYAQPDVEPGHAEKGFGDVAQDWSQADGARRQRQTADQGRGNADFNARHVWVPESIRRGDGVGDIAWAGSLQDRLCEPDAQDSDRGGWDESRVSATPSVGCTQGQFFAWRRVDSVEVLQRDDPGIPGDGHVYNIEVDNCHTYVANGVVVHNCHHALTGNKWGQAVALFPRARGVGVTATPVRADRKSLHRKQGGVFDDMVIGPTMRDLIDRGALCDYRIFAPPQSIDASTVKIGSTGDYSQPGLREAAHKSRIVGDVVSHYLKFARGLRGITFVVDVEQAVELAEAFTEAGVPAMAVSAKTPDAVRAEAVAKLRDGKVLQLVNVDLFGEGFDVPAVECVSMARPTMSYGLYVQQFGRALRPLEGKSHGIVIDHVGNVKQHGLPDAPRNWTLYQEERGKRAKRDETITPITSCLQCFRAYEATHSACPHCGYKPEPEGRGRPEQVDGDLVELDPSVLAQMRGEADRIMGDAQVPHGATKVVEMSVKKRWSERQEAQEELRRRMALWGGLRRDMGDTDSMMQRRFFFRFGIDVMSAQALKASEANTLADRIAVDWSDMTG